MRRVPSAVLPLLLCAVVGAWPGADPAEEGWEVQQLESGQGDSRGPVQLLRPIALVTKPQLQPAPKPAEVARVAWSARALAQDEAAAGFLTMFETLARREAHKASTTVAQHMRSSREDQKRANRFAYQALMELRPQAINLAAAASVRGSARGSAQQSHSEAFAAMRTLFKTQGSAKAINGALTAFAAKVARRSWGRVRMRVPQLLTDAVRSVAEQQARLSVSKLIAQGKQLQQHPMQQAVRVQTVDHTQHMLQSKLDKAVSMSMVQAQTQDAVVTRTARFLATEMQAGATTENVLAAQSDKFAGSLARAAAAQAVNAQVPKFNVEADKIAKAQLATAMARAKYLDYDAAVIAQATLQKVLWRDAPAAIAEASKKSLSELSIRVHDKAMNVYGVGEIEEIERLVQRVAAAKVATVVPPVFYRVAKDSQQELKTAAEDAAKAAQGSGAHLAVGMAESAAHHAFVFKTVPAAEAHASAAAVNATLPAVEAEMGEMCVKKLTRTAISMGTLVAFELLVAHGLEWAQMGVEARVREVTSTHLKKVGINPDTTKSGALQFALEIARGDTWTSRLPLLEHTVIQAARKASSDAAQTAIATAVQGGTSAMSIVRKTLPKAVQEAVLRAAREFSSRKQDASKFSGEAAWKSRVSQRLAAHAAAVAANSTQQLYHTETQRLARMLAVQVAAIAIHSQSFPEEAKQLALERILAVTAHLAVVKEIKRVLPLSKVAAVVHEKTHKTALDAMKRAFQHGEPFEFEVNKAVREEAETVVHMMVNVQGVIAKKAAVTDTMNQLHGLKSNLGTRELIKELVKNEALNLGFEEAGPMTMSVAVETAQRFAGLVASRAVDSLSSKLGLTDNGALIDLQDAAVDAISRYAKLGAARELRGFVETLLASQADGAFNVAAAAYKQRMELAPAPVAFTAQYDSSEQAQAYLKQALMSPATRRVLQQKANALLTGPECYQAAGVAIVAAAQARVADDASMSAVQEISKLSAKKMVHICKSAVRSSAKAAALEVFVANKLSDPSLTAPLVKVAIQGCEEQIFSSVLYHVLRQSHHQTYIAVSEAVRRTIGAASTSLDQLHPLVAVARQAAAATAKQHYLVIAKHEATSYLKNAAAGVVRSLLQDRMTQAVEKQMCAKGLNRVKLWAVNEARNSSALAAHSAVEAALQQHSSETLLGELESNEARRLAISTVSGVLNGRLSNHLGAEITNIFERIAGKRIQRAIQAAQAQDRSIQTAALVATHEAEAISKQNLAVQKVPMMAGQVAEQQLSLIMQGLNEKVQLIQRIVAEEVQVGVHQAANHFQIHNSQLLHHVKHETNSTLYSRMKSLGASKDAVQPAMMECTDIVTVAAQVASHEAVLTTMISAPSDTVTAAAMKAAYIMSEKTTLLSSIQKAAREAAFSQALVTHNAAAQLASSRAVASVVSQMVPKLAAKALQLQVLKQSLQLPVALENIIYKHSVKMCRAELNHAALVLANSSMAKFGMLQNQSKVNDGVMQDAIMKSFETHEAWNGLLASVQKSFELGHSELNNTLWQAIQKAASSGKSISQATSRIVHTSAAEVVMANAKRAAADFLAALVAKVRKGVDKVALGLSGMSGVVYRAKAESELQVNNVPDNDEPTKQFSKDELNRTQILQIVNHTNTTNSTTSWL